MTYQFSFDYFGSIIHAESLGDLVIPNDNRVLTACCISFTEDQNIIAVNVRGRGVDIPGGHVDPGETPVAAMHRELLEEAAVLVGSPTLIDVVLFKSEDTKLGLDEKPYMLVYAAMVKETKAFIENDEIIERLILTPEEFIQRYFADHAYAQWIAERAARAIS